MNCYYEAPEFCPDCRGEVRQASLPDIALDESIDLAWSYCAGGEKAPCGWNDCYYQIERPEDYI